MTKPDEKITSYALVAKKRVIDYVFRTGEVTFTFADVNTTPGVLCHLESAGFIVRSEPRTCSRKVYALSERERSRLKQSAKSKITT